MYNFLFISTVTNNATKNLAFESLEQSTVLYQIHHRLLSLYWFHLRRYLSSNNF